MKPYFSHDEGARNDPKLIEVMMTLGHEGKSVYWDLVEMLFEQNGYLMLSQCKGYAFALRTDCDLILKLVNDFGLFVSDGEKFWSETGLRRLEQRNAKSIKAKESAAKRWAGSERNANALPTQCEGNAIKVNKTKVKSSNDDKPPLSDDLKARLAKLTDTSGELLWKESILSKPDYFAKVAAKLDLGNVDLEHYRKAALLVAEADNSQRSIKGWESWVANYFTNQKKGGPLLTLTAGLPTVPTPRDELPAPGQERKGQVIAIKGIPTDASMNRMLVTAAQKHWPTATIHAIMPR